MDNKEIDRLVASWYRYRALGAKSEEGAKHVWAVKTLTALIPDSIPENPAERKSLDYELGWKIVLRMLDSAPTRKELRLVAPTLGRMIRLHQSQLMERVSEQVEHNPRLSYAVAYIYSTDFDSREHLKSLGRPWVSLDFGDEQRNKHRQYLEELSHRWIECACTPSDVQRMRLMSPEPMQELDALAYEDPNACWDGILLILRQCTTKKELRLLAEHLAVLLSSASGPHFLVIVSTELEHNKRLAYTVTKLTSTSLGHAWRNEWQALIALAQKKDVNALFD